MSETNVALGKYEGKTAITFGVFDLLHFGHFELFRRIRELVGDSGKVYVMLQIDESIAKYKPGCQSVYDFKTRKAMIDTLRTVTEALPYDAVGIEAVEDIPFDVLVVGPEHTNERFQRLFAWCKEHGKDVYTMPRTDGISTTKLKEILTANHECGHSKRSPFISVIGGNGVAATNRLCQLIEEKLTRAGAYRDAHHPEMVIWQATQAPSRSMFLEGRGPDWRPDYIRIAKALKSLGCDQLCMCCNTAHFAIEDLERESGVPFINIIREVAKECKRLNGKRIGILASDGCVKFDLYGKYFQQEYPEAELVYPDVEMQQLVTRGICNAKSSARYGEKNASEIPGALFGKVINHLSDKGCDLVVLGCTDINAVYDPSVHRPVEIVDSLDVLAEAIIRESKGKMS